MSGGADGIDARNDGNGLLSVTTNGTVTGGTGAAIATRTDPGLMSNITLNSGADVSATSGIAITNDAGDSNTLVNTGATVSGNITLADGSDDLTFDGGTFSGTPTFDGGDDASSADGFIDRLSFSGNSGTATIINWEEIFLANSTLTFNGSGGNFTAPEVLSLSSGSDLTIAGNFIGTGGRLIQDVDLASDEADTLTITGTSSGTTTVTVNAQSSGPASGNDITLITVNGAAGADDFVMDNFLFGAYLFELLLSGNDFVLTRKPVAGDPRL